MRGLNKDKVLFLKNAFAKTQEKKLLFQMRHKKKLMRRLAAFAVIAFITLGTTLSAVISQSLDLKEREKELTSAKQELVELKQEQTKAEKELERLQDDEYIAELARKNYFMSEDGEIIFNIPETEEAKSDKSQ